MSHLRSYAVSSNLIILMILASRSILNSCVGTYHTCSICWARTDADVMIPSPVTISLKERKSRLTDLHVSHVGSTSCQLLQHVVLSNWHTWRLGDRLTLPSLGCKLVWRPTTSLGCMSCYISQHVSNVYYMPAYPQSMVHLTSVVFINDVRLLLDCWHVLPEWKDGFSFFHSLTFLNPCTSLQLFKKKKFVQFKN